MGPALITTQAAAVLLRTSPVRKLSSSYCGFKKMMPRIAAVSADRSE